MLERLTADGLERYAPWAYQLAMSPEHASYPTWRDGVKTREDFMRRAQRGLRDDELLLYRHEGAACGWIQ